MKKLGFLSFLLLIFFSACHRDSDELTTTVILDDPVYINWEAPNQSISASLTGFVEDQNNQPVTNASVQLNGITVMTDAYGHFFFENEIMNALGTLVTVRKPGYFEGSRRCFPVENLNNRIKIQLIEKSYIYSFEANIGGTISFENEASVTFSPNTIGKEDGTIYNGTVRVAAQWYSPTSVSSIDKMPGNFQGLNLNVEQIVLANFGMINIELESENNEPLYIINGETADVSIPISEELLSIAPPEIALWSYNKEHGLWIEETMAALQDNQYVGTVNHFSFWTCSKASNFVKLEMSLLDGLDKSINNHLVQLKSEGYSSAFGYSGEEGSLSFFVPQNKDMLLEIYDPCGEILFNQSIGSFDIDTYLGNITASAPNINNVTVTGNLQGCNGASIPNGLIIATIGESQSYHYRSSPIFSITISACDPNASIEIIAVDLDNLNQSEVAIIEAQGFTDLEAVEICESQAPNFIKIIVEQNGIYYTEIYNNVMVPSALENQSTQIQSGALTTDQYLYFEFYGTNTGNYSNDHSIAEIIDNNREWVLVDDAGLFENLEITEYTNPNVQDEFSGTVSGIFNGTMMNIFGGANEQVQISGEFSITQ